jgi:cytochrome c oxidase subunit II
MRRWVAFCVGLGLFALVVALPAAAALTDPASPRMEFWNRLFMQIFWIAMVVGVLVWGLLIYAVVRFRARKGGPKEGPHIHGNTKMEIAWTIAPALVMGWLLVVSFNGLFAIDNGPPQTDTTIKITASQFTFTFEYEDGSKGTSPPESIYIEQNKYIMFDITSVDVIHAFSVPELGLMKDAVPGRMNHDWVQPTKVGNFSIKCRELCGAGHSAMVGQIVVFPEGARGGLAFGPAASPGAATTSPTTSAPATNTTAATNGSAPANGTRVPVTLAPGGALSINPADLKVDTGTVVFEIKSEGGTIPHNLFIGPRRDTSKPDDGAEWKSKTLGSSADTAEIVAAFDKDATYEYWCDIPGHFDGGMKGTLTVGKGGGEIPSGPKPILPGFELVGLVFAVAVIAMVLRRRA